MIILPKLASKWQSHEENLKTMKVLLVGSGGREHAIAWKLAQSPHLERLYSLPGSPGTALLGENIPLRADDTAAVVDQAVRLAVDLVVIGPEAPLAAGLADRLLDAGIKVFGPTSAAAEIETSKAFAKAFMARHCIPTASFQTFNSLSPALEALETFSTLPVIKVSGLAAGKGVFLPETLGEARQVLEEILVERTFGAAGSEVVLEERLEGEEVSLLAFTDGLTVRTMPPAQDHKRLLDGDLGPNTGGMGAVAPTPACRPELVDELVHTVLQPAVDGLYSEGRPFIGVLYAGLMLTRSGPRVLEFNCRLGDPETQVLLPLLDGDLLEIMLACADGRLSEVRIEWNQGAAACVVLASGGYPASLQLNRPIEGLEFARQSALIFHAGTKETAGILTNAGGRVLDVTGLGEDLPGALQRAYAAVEQIRFDGMQFRRDIGHRALDRLSTGQESVSAYASAGVDIDAGNRAVRLMKSAVQSTYNDNVLAGIGSFGGLFSAAPLANYSEPVLVASIDGVGTKVKLAARVGRCAGLGEDLVNHCINDILVQGARPLFFMDYFAADHLDPAQVAEIVSGIAKACREAGCALLGGETAEMPGVYRSGEFDMAGAVFGVVERRRILPRTDLQAGDVLIGLASSGPHTNGYSLIRKLVANIPLETILPGMQTSLADALLAPHRSYLPLIGAVLEKDPSLVKALAHITGGGFLENIPRILPDGLQARISPGSWPVPPLFRFLQEQGQVSSSEMARVFNLGIGMVAVVSAGNAAVFQSSIPEETWVIGALVPGTKGVVLG